MNKLTRIAILATAALATVAAPLSTASADHRRDGWHGSRDGWRDGPRRPYYRERHHRNNNNSDALAAGVLGLAAGAIIGGALSQSQPRYDEPRLIYDPNAGGNYYPTAPQQQYRPVTAPRYNTGYAMEPWSPEWQNYCASRYRSFNPQTGTYRGYDGGDHFCTAN